MPIEIRELVIKAVVDQEERRAPAADRDGGQGLSDTVVNQIAEKVLEIINEKSER